MRERSPLLLSLALTLSLAPSLAALQQPEWPRWRGPLSTGEAPGADPPLTWSEDEGIAWKAPLPGHGKSTPIVSGDRIFLQAAVPTREATEEELAARARFEEQLTEAPDRLVQLLVLALDRKSGEVLWQTVVGERLPFTGVHETNGYASFSPVTDGRTLFASFGSLGVYALDAASGEVRWTYELGPQRMRNGWGEAGSPALAGDTLIVLADQEDPSHIAALDAATGKVRWRRERDEPSTWTTPVVVEAGGRTQVVVNGTTAVRCYDLATGEVRWSRGGQTVNAIPTPVTDGVLLAATSGYRGSTCLALALADGSVAWSHGDGTPYVPSPLLVDERLYLLSKNSGRLTCLDFRTGELLLDRARLDLADVYASPISAAGRIYVVGRDGTTVVLRHGDELEVLAVNELDDPIDASPVAVGGALYLRSDSHLYAIGTP